MENTVEVTSLEIVVMEKCACRKDGGMEICEPFSVGSHPLDMDSMLKVQLNDPLSTQMDTMLIFLFSNKQLAWREGVLTLCHSCCPKSYCFSSPSPISVYIGICGSLGGGLTGPKQKLLHNQKDSVTAGKHAAAFQ